MLPRAVQQMNKKGSGEEGMLGIPLRGQGRNSMAEALRWGERVLPG